MVIFNNTNYNEEASKRLANYICQSAIENNVSMIGFFLDRSPELLYIIKAFLDNKITFIPIDPTLPKEYVEHIIRDSEVEIVITLEKYKNRFWGIKTIIVDNIRSHKRDSPLETVETDVAYVLYTSGSTGVPKSVEITRNSLINFVEGISDVIDFSVGKRIACLTTMSFDIFFLESVVALYKGLTVVLANENEQHNPRLMTKLIQDNEVDMIQMTPSRMQLLLNHDKELSCLKNVKEIMLGGEQFPVNLLRILQKKTTAKIYNMYGPTEATIWSSVSDLTNKENVDIGRPIMNTEIYIVDENLVILPYGQVGEICIAGEGLAKGYVGRNDLTAEKFMNLPQNRCIKVFRTGDFGRYLEAGNLEYLGRIDNQVKIRGYRIELEEIEQHLNQFKGIKQSVVVVTETNEVDKILEAFYTSDESIDSWSIANFLFSKLPSYMIVSELQKRSLKPDQYSFADLNMLKLTFLPVSLLWL